MIAYIDGKLALKEATHVIVEANGIGYQVAISLNTFSAIKEEERCKLFTYFHVKEDIQALYGFKSMSEKNVFMHLISISGIGPNTALVMLGSLTPAEICNAIVQEDVPTIQGVKGIGAKTAQRVILELKDKMAKLGLADDSSETSTGTVHNTQLNEALTALVTLGIPRKAAEKNLDMVVKQNGNGLTLEEMIKLALKRG